MLKRKNFVTDSAKLMCSIMVIFICIQPVTLSTAQSSTVKDENKSDSVQKSLEIKEEISRNLTEREDHTFNIIVHNYDTLFILREKKAKKRILLSSKKKQQKKQTRVLTYKMFPIFVDSQDLADFTAKYPTDTIPLKIEIERIPEKRNIFDKIFKPIKKKKNGKN